ncbi:MAG TPA: DUF5940 domain-containing protein, partial [Acidimicrobiales bacterium]|nr:DUF5940 domain-containing protein [Acidimicrobiales bacterium]
RRPEELRTLPRPWWAHPLAPARHGPWGVIVDQDDLYAALAAADGFGLVELDGPPGEVGPRDLVRYGSKPTRSPEELARARLRGFDEVLAYPPHQVFVGNRRPEELRTLPRPWWAHPLAPARHGPWGVIVDQEGLYAALAAADGFGLVELDGPPGEVGPRDLVLYRQGDPAGVMRAAHSEDEALTAPVLLENLAAKATGVLALRHLLAQVDLPASSVELAVGCGEEAVGDRYQRGGGNLAKAIAEGAGCGNASGHDVKAFCAGPLHALMVAGSLVAAGVFRHVVVVAGGSLAKLGMKVAGAARSGGPVLEDVLAGLAILVAPAAAGAGTLRLDAVGRHRVASGSGQQALLRDLVEEPLTALGMKMLDVGAYATELHDPEVTEPAGAGNVPARNYRMLAGLAALRGELDRHDLDRFEAERGMPGFSPTQGHLASAVPFLPHALARLGSGELHSALFMAKGSLFLGRMTELADGLSVLVERS